MELKAAPPDETKEELAILTRAVNIEAALKRDRRLLVRGGIGFGILFGVVQLLTKTITSNILIARGHPDVIYISLMLLIVISSQLYSRKNTPAIVAAKELTKRDEIAQIGALIVACDICKGKPEQRVFVDALVRLLPKLQEANASLLNPDHLEILIKILNTPSEKDNFRSLIGRGNPTLNKVHLELQLIIIKTLEQMGDATALTAVRFIAVNAAHSPGKKELKRAAQESLPALIERAKRLKLKNVLLRPSTESSETLLRPAQSTGESDSETLLRHV